MTDESSNGKSKLMFVGMLMAAVLLALPVIASITAPQHAYAFQQVAKQGQKAAGLVNVGVQQGSICVVCAGK